MAREFSLPYRVAKDVARLGVKAVTRPHWSGAENLPASGGFIAVANHISEFDSMTFMHFLVDNGIPVRTLAKKELFAVPALGWLMRRAGQVPVDRTAGHGAASLEAAERALRAGECIGIYPEGTLTRDPDSWPMRGRSGAARLALRTRVPVIPVAQWGAQDVLGRYRRIPNLIGRKDVWVRAGCPVDLADLYDHANDPAAWRQATDRIMAVLVAMVEELRGHTMDHAPIDGRAPSTMSKKQVARLEKSLCKRLRVPPSRRVPGQGIDG